MLKKLRKKLKSPQSATIVKSETDIFKLKELTFPNQLRKELKVIGVPLFTLRIKEINIKANKITPRTRAHKPK